jgi:hypothetical protein
MPAESPVTEADGVVSAVSVVAAVSFAVLQAATATTIAHAAEARRTALVIPFPFRSCRIFIPLRMMERARERRRSISPSPQTPSPVRTFVGTPDR